MVIVTSGLDWQGKPCSFALAESIVKNLDPVKEVLSKKDFDFVSLICGLPGMGKSNLAISLAKYCDPNFTEKNIAFTDKEFIEITNNCQKQSAVILDESFASLNSRITMTKEFSRIINHLQLIRQKNLYIFLCIPNFFDLSKGVAIIRSSMLFLTYGEKFGDRGKVAVFGREEKRMLYVLGSKYMNYLAVKANFITTFSKQKAIDEEVYKEMKAKHLLSLEDNPINELENKQQIQRDKLITFCHYIMELPIELIQEVAVIGETAIYESSKPYKEEIIQRYANNRKFIEKMNRSYKKFTKMYGKTMENAEKSPLPSPP